jgi:hypothetical protein
MPSGFAVLARADEDKLGADRIAGLPARRNFQLTNASVQHAPAAEDMA